MTFDFLRSVSSPFFLKENPFDPGVKVSSLKEMVSALKNTTSLAVKHHLNGRNDFHSWVTEVIGDKVLGFRLTKISDHDSEKALKDLIREFSGRVIELEAGSSALARMKQVINEVENSKKTKKEFFRK